MKQMQLVKDMKATQQNKQGERSDNNKKSMKINVYGESVKKKALIKVVVQFSNERIDFENFIDGVINFKSEENCGVNKRPSENEVYFKGKLLDPS